MCGEFAIELEAERIGAYCENWEARGGVIVVVKSVGADALYAHQEVAHEEMTAEENVIAALKENEVESKFFWGSTLFHIDDLPFKLEEMPSNYRGFRERVQQVKVRTTIPAPKQLKGIPVRGNVNAGDIPSLQNLGLQSSLDSCMI
jgi:deoxyribodipyrimidine photolyase